MKIFGPTGSILGGIQHLWASQVSVVKGQTYEFSFDYWNTVSKDLVSAGFMDAVIDGQVAMMMAWAFFFRPTSSGSAST